jgi:hypothetical protein
MRGKNAGTRKRQQSAHREKQILPGPVKKIAPKVKIEDVPYHIAMYDHAMVRSIPLTPGTMFSSLSLPGGIQLYSFMERLIYQCKSK